MDLLCVILICVGTPISLAATDHNSPATEEILSSSAVIQQFIERFDMLEKHDAKQTIYIQSMEAEMLLLQAKEIQSLKAEMSQQQAKEIQSLKAEMSQRQAKEIQTLKAEMSQQQAIEIQSLKAEMSQQQANEIQSLKAVMSKQQAKERQSLKAEMSQRQAKEIQSLKAEMSQQQAIEIQSLKAEMSQQQAKEIQSLKAEMSQQHAKELQSLKAEMSQQQAIELQSLKAEMSQQQAKEIQSLKAVMSQQQAKEIQSLKAVMSQQQAKEIQSLKAEMLQQQAKEIQSLKEEMSQQQAKDMSQQRRNMMKLRSKLYTKDRLIHKLLNGVTEPNMGEDLSNTKMDKDAYYQITKVHDGAQQRQGIRDTTKRIIPVENVPVAFSANLRHTTTPHDIIVFDDVITNVGNAYNSSSGVFTAPVSGIYVFSTNLAIKNSTSVGYLAVNGQMQLTLYMDSEHSETTSQTVVFQLNHRDRVAIDGVFGSFYASHRSSFSGFLLIPTQPSFNSAPVIG